MSLQTDPVRAYAGVALPIHAQSGEVCWNNTCHHHLHHLRHDRYRAQPSRVYYYMVISSSVPLFISES